MIKRYKEWVKLREEGEQPAAGFGHLGHTSNSYGDVGTGGGEEASHAFKDIAEHLVTAMQGANGIRALNAIVSAILDEHSVPEDIKQKLRQRIGDKWSHVIDLSQASSPGHGQGLGNVSHKAGLGMHPVGTNVVVPSSADGYG